MPEGLKVEELLEDTKYQDNLMKKYKLQDLVANGSHSRLKVDSDLLVGDINNGYGYGDVLDANATKDVATNIADNKANAVREELIGMIRALGNISEQDITGILAAIEEIKAKNLEQDLTDEQFTQIVNQVIQQVEKVQPTVGGDNDNLIFDL